MCRRIKTVFKCKKAHKKNFDAMTYLINEASRRRQIKGKGTDSQTQMTNRRDEPCSGNPNRDATSLPCTSFSEPASQELPCDTRTPFTKNHCSTVAMTSTKNRAKASTCASKLDRHLILSGPIIRWDQPMLHIQKVVWPTAVHHRSDSTTDTPWGEKESFLVHHQIS